MDAGNFDRKFSRKISGDESGFPSQAPLDRTTRGRRSLRFEADNPADFVADGCGAQTSQQSRNGAARAGNTVDARLSPSHPSAALDPQAVWRRSLLFG
jgi:hypothetical protein